MKKRLFTQSSNIIKDVTVYLLIKCVDFPFAEGTVAAKPSRYSKEEIERKKLEAQNRRRQKMAQKQKNQK